MGDELSLMLLGGVRIEWQHKPLTGFISSKAQALLIYLALTKIPHSRQALVGLLWGETVEKSARANLRVTLSNLHSLVPGQLIISRQTIAIDPSSAHWLDVDAFKAGLHRSDGPPTNGEIAALRAAVEIYRGDFLAGFYVREARMFEEWVLAQRESLRQLQLQALYTLGVALGERREYATALDYLARLLIIEPWQEEAHQQMMLLLARNGQRSAALAQYETCRRLLAKELGIEPSRAIQHLYHQIRMMEGQPSSLSEKALTQESEDRRALLLQVTGPKASPAAATVKVEVEQTHPPVTQELGATVLVGRQQQWDSLMEACQAALAGHPRVVLLSGEMGSGKTRLADEFLAWAGRQGIAVSGARTHPEDTRLSFAPLLDWLDSPAIRPALAALDEYRLAHVSELLPGLGTGHPDLPHLYQGSESRQRRQLFEAFTRAIVVKPLVLLLDGLQWCDPDTLEWLHYLLRFNSGAQLLLICTQRPEEVEPDEVSRFGQYLWDADLITQLDLKPLGPVETAAVAAQVVGKELPPRQARQLYQESEGVPMFVVELARAFQIGEKNPARVEGGSDLTLGLPPRLLTALEGRLARLSPTARDLACVAASIGQMFSASLLEQLWPGDEVTLVNGLDELCKRRILLETGEEMYRFSHNKLWQVAVSATSSARRRILQRQLARATAGTEPNGS
jgi:DNA-binding SARP family transcriptional activator